MAYNNRLSELRGRMSQREFAEKIGLSQQNYGKYEQGKQKLNSELITTICKTFGCTAEWLLGLDDEGGPDTRSLPKGAIPVRRSTPAYLPLRGRVHAGDAQEPDIIEEQIPAPDEIAERHPNAYFLEVEGNCMNKVYPEGCYILIDHTKEPQSGSIAVVSIDGADYVMRRLYRGANTLVLSPESWSDEYEDIVVKGDEHSVELVGTVVWFQANREME